MEREQHTMTDVWGTKPDRAEAWKPVAEMDGCSFSRYQVSDQGRHRNAERLLSARARQGKHDDYVRINLSCDEKDVCPRQGRHTFTMHKVVLTTFAGPRPAGLEACHSPRGSGFNWYPEGVRWGSKADNHADMAAAGNAKVPESFPCRNAPRCTETVKNPGRRCLACVTVVGLHAAALLELGMPLQQVGERFGYSGGDWVYRLAVDHGGYEGAKADARTQRPGLGQRARLRLYLRKVHDA